jgi:sialic acid synthase SpsE
MTKIIAEIGWNHMGSLSLAKKMIFQAKKNGADIVKTQIFDVQNLKKGPWDKDGRREIYKKAQLDENKYRALFKYAKKINCKFFASAMSIKDAKLIKNVNNDFIKIPSMESRNFPLISYCAKNFKNVIISSGTSKFKEIIKSCKKIPKKKLTILHCVSSYPCNFSDVNLPKIDLFKNFFKNVGFSDHTQGIEASILSLKYNPIYIEKHFTIDNSLPGRDNKFAILPHNLKTLKDFIEKNKVIDQFKGKDYLKCEIEARKIYSGRWSKE